MTLLRFTEDTEVEIENLKNTSNLHIDDISSAISVEYDEDGTITTATIDMSELVRALKLYAAVEEFRYGWR